MNKNEKLRWRRIFDYSETRKCYNAELQPFLQFYIWYSARASSELHDMYRSTQTNKDSRETNEFEIPYSLSLVKQIKVLSELSARYKVTSNKTWATAESSF